LATSSMSWWRLLNSDKSARPGERVKLKVLKIILSNFLKLAMAIQRLDDLLILTGVLNWPISEA